jgi:hypothetical protein
VKHRGLDISRSTKKSIPKKHSISNESNLSHFSFGYLSSLSLNSPFGLGGSDKASLTNMREAELKHCRLAMLAAAGWPIAELFDKQLAESAGLPTALTKSGASPSILNGGLDKIEIAYWVAVVSLAGIVELENMKVKEEKGKAYITGDCGFDPIGLYPKEKKGQMEMQTKELKNGRLAMMAILGFAVQEALFQSPVVLETPVFFQPLF